MKENQYGYLKKFRKHKKCFENSAASPFLTINQIILMQIATGDCVVCTHQKFFR
jgi:hypothetical protein